MKFSYTKNPESEYFYKESKSNKKKIWRLGGEGREWGGVGWGGGVARVSDFFSFSKESKSEKIVGLASVSEFVLQRIQI